MDNNDTNLKVKTVFELFKRSGWNEDEIIRNHFWLVGPSGSGKTYTIESLCKEMDFFFLPINAAQITKEGTSGSSLSKELAPLKDHQNEKCVIFVDEFDKLFISNNSNSSKANDITIGVQNEFLKVLESRITKVFGNYGHYDTINVSKCLFIFSGAFNNELDIDEDKLRDFGVKTEFLGRVNMVYNTEPISLCDLYNVLEESNDLENYLRLYSDINRDDAIYNIKKRIKEKFRKNPFGYRLVKNEIANYFIEECELPPERE